MIKIFLIFLGIQIFNLNFLDPQRQVWPMEACEYRMVLDVVGEFKGEQTVVDINGRNVFSGKITTNWSNGIAGHVAQSVENPEVLIKIEFPELSLKLSKRFNLKDGKYFEISVIEKKLVINQFSAMPLRD